MCYEFFNKTYFVQFMNPSVDNRMPSWYNLNINSGDTGGSCVRIYKGTRVPQNFLLKDGMHSMMRNFEDGQVSHLFVMDS